VGRPAPQPANFPGPQYPITVERNFYITVQLNNEEVFSMARLTLSTQVAVLTLMDNFFDGLLPSTPVARRRRGLAAPGPVAPLPPPLTAEHGLSFLVQVVTEGQRHTVLFDFGGSKDGVVRNLAPLRVDLATVGALVLSHGHFDHFTGLEELARDLPAGGLPFYVGPEAFHRRFLARPDGVLVDLGRLDPERVRGLGLEIREVREPQEILPGILVTGPIPRVTPFERGTPALLVERNGERQTDDFPGELSLVFNLAGRGLVVLTACAHAGVINTVRWAREVTGEEKVYAVLGGFHLSGAPEEVVRNTVDSLKALGPRYVVPMHCTGFFAVRLLAAEMPEAFVLASTGTEYVFAAE
jgi:7,8-dihydropterin-6-yl-methyl-4-(beta-D-ribofuranosyl)aminobenzene 5'-phosphate synthase